VWTALCILAVLPFLFLGLRESVRWLVVNGRLAEATIAIKAMAASANVALTEVDEVDIRATWAALSNAPEKDASSVGDLFRRKYLRRTTVGIASFVAVFQWTFRCRCWPGVRQWPVTTPSP